MSQSKFVAQVSDACNLEKTQPIFSEEWTENYRPTDIRRSFGIPNIYGALVRALL